MARTRRFWQIHLSTAVVLMFASGLFVWGNAIPRDSFFEPIRNVFRRNESGIETIERAFSRREIYGWPYVIYKAPVLGSSQAVVGGNVMPAQVFVQEQGKLRWQAMIANIFVLALGLLPVALFWEWFIHDERPLANPKDSSAPHTPTLAP